MSRTRLEAFSDGVFAVAITLLALDLVVESLIRHVGQCQRVSFPVVPPSISPRLRPWASVADHRVR